MQLKHVFQDNQHHFIHQGVPVEVRRYEAPSCWQGFPAVEGWEYFISIDGDDWPYGYPYFTLAKAIASAKRRIEKGDFLSSA
jgi:hypothetical protein